MKSAKKAHAIPSLVERVTDLLVELEEALDELAAERKAQVASRGPENREGAAIPHSTFRQLIDQRGFGDCLCRSYLAAKQERS
jgi:hypothetical protein